LKDSDRFQDSVPYKKWTLKQKEKDNRHHLQEKLVEHLEAKNQ
jgi:hypothetical protein